MPQDSISVRRQHYFGQRPSKSVAQLRLECYERLGISPDQVAVAPSITPVLESALARAIPGDSEGTFLSPQAAAIRYLRGSDAKEARAFILLYDEQSATAHRLLPIEAFSLAANIPPRRLLSVIFDATLDQSIQIGALKAAVAHPSIVDAAVISAQSPDKDGLGDRRMMLQHAQFLPMPKGSTVNVNVRANATAQAASASGPLPSMADDMRSLSERFNSPSRVIEASAPVEQLDATLVTAALPAHQSTLVEAELARHLPGSDERDDAPEPAFRERYQQSSPAALSLEGEEDDDT